MTLPDAEVIDLLREEFVVGWTNIEREDHVGLSHGYSPHQTAVGTTNGAGGRNVQLLILSADGIVLHALPGFWHPEDLVSELRFGKQVHRLWLDPDRSQSQKEAMFRRLHEAALARVSVETTARSAWQGFDQWEESRRCQKELRDTMQTDQYGYPVRNGGQIALKALNIVSRERMIARPFMALADFDVENFVDYGRVYYDLNSGRDRGKIFRHAEKRAMTREKEQLEERQQKEREMRR